MSILLSGLEEHKLKLLYVGANIPGVQPEDKALLERAVCNPLTITRAGVNYLLNKYGHQLPPLREALCCGYIAEHVQSDEDGHCLGCG